MSVRVEGEVSAVVHRRGEVDALDEPTIDELKVRIATVRPKRMTRSSFPPPVGRTPLAAKGYRNRKTK